MASELQFRAHFWYKFQFRSTTCDCKSHLNLYKLNMFDLTAFPCKAAFSAFVLIVVSVRRAPFWSKGQNLCRWHPGKVFPGASQTLQPFAPLYCFMFKRAAFAGKSNEQTISIAWTLLSPNGVFTSTPAITTTELIMELHVGCPGSYKQKIDILSYYLIGQIQLLRAQV